MAKLCILTPDPSYNERWHDDADHYRTLFGKSLTFRNWKDAGNLGRFDKIMPLLCWGYPLDTAHWFTALDAWEDAGLPFSNSIATLRWNTNKDYLFDLEECGVAIVPSRLAHALNREDVQAARDAWKCEQLVVKPTISAGAIATYVLKSNDPIPFDALEREMLIQPMMPSITSEGEFSLLYFGGAFSHAVLKSPVAADFRVQSQFGGSTRVIDAPAAAKRLAEAAMAAAPGPLTYARVDMLRDKEGGFRIMELELIEPALFLDHAPDKGAALAKAIIG